MSRFSSDNDKTAVWCVRVCKLSLAFNMTVTAAPVTQRIKPFRHAGH